MRFHTAGGGCSTHPAPTNPFKPLALTLDSDLWCGCTGDRGPGPMLVASNRASPQPSVRRTAMAEYDLYTMARFWAKVKVGSPSQCWPWLGGANEQGYGRFRTGSSRTGAPLLSPHRVAWEMANGPIPERPEYHGAAVMHRCDNPRCCNWRHLKLGTQADNVLDMDVKGRRVSRSKITLSLELITAVIADPRPHREVAAAYGLSKTHVGALKRGDRRKLSRQTMLDRQEATRAPAPSPMTQPLLF